MRRCAGRARDSRSSSGSLRSGPISAGSPEIGPHDALRAADAIAQAHGLHPVSIRQRALSDVLEQHPNPARGAVRSQHRLERGNPDTRLRRERAGPAPAGVEARPSARRRGERIVRPVVRADAVAQPAVPPGDAEALRPRVLVERHRLDRVLPADPSSVLRQDDAGATLHRRERRATPPSPPPTTRTCVRSSHISVTIPDAWEGDSPLRLR